MNSDALRHQDKTSRKSILNTKVGSSDWLDAPHQSL
jgi:hypothetical protein